MEMKKIIEGNKEFAKINTLGLKRLYDLYEHFYERLADSNTRTQVAVNEMALARILARINVKEGNK